MKKPFPRLLIAGVVGMLFLNLLQASFTELLYDEAYYWYYSLEPAWGYFDHPPMVAWMIRIGDIFLGGELGVRFISCLMGSGTLLLFWWLIQGPGKEKNLWVLLAWLGSIPLLHAYNFLSLPDTPLIFFSALFLLAYRRFLRDPRLATSLLLGLCMAALMYSKYHAALVILFTLASNPALIRNRFAWLALAIALICYAPHLGWLYNQDFVSLRYHLFERPNQPYDFGKFTGGYLLNLVALFGLCFPWAFASLVKYETGDRFRRALKFIAWGILLFFLVSSFQRRVQTQWLIAACVPVAVMTAELVLARPGWRKWVFRTALANLFILMFLRVGLVFEPLFPVRFEAHGNRQWVSNLKQVADGSPVVFENSYRQASMYHFYSREPSFSLNNSYYRKNQYSIDGSEARMQGKRIFFIRVIDRESPYYYTNQEGERKYGYFIEPFVSYRKLRAGIRPKSSYIPGDPAEFWIYNPYPYPIPTDSLRFGMAQMDEHKRNLRVLGIDPDPGLPLADMLMPGDSLEFRFKNPKVPEGGETPAYIRAVTTVPGLLYGMNGNAQKIRN